MKWNEAVFRALGEIDAEAIPDKVAGSEKQEDDAEVPRRRKRSPRRLVLVLTAAVLLCAGIGLFAALQTEKPAEGDPTGEFPGELPAIQAPIPETEKSPAVPTQDPGGKAEDIFLYLTPGPFDDFIPIERVLDLPVPQEPSPEPQIFPEEGPERIALPGSCVIGTRDGGAVRVVCSTEYRDSETLPLMRNLERDLSFANFTRSYGCVLWEADWDRGEARYLGVVPLSKPEETDALLLTGNYLTSVPEERTPAFTPETLPGLVGRRTLVYLLTPASDRIMIYECYFIRLENGAGWGLYYVPAADLSGIVNE